MTEYAVARPARAGAIRAAAGRRVPGVLSAALVWLALVLAVAVFAELISPYGYSAIDLRNRLSPPVGFGGISRHILGTDELGRDVLSRLIFSIRMSLLVAFGATILGAFIGIVLGVVAAHFGRLVGHTILALVDFQASMPFLVLALAVLAFFGNSLPLFIALLGFHGWERYTRITRALTLSAKERNYVKAVRQLGARPLRIYCGHILPNIASSLIVTMTLAFPEIILTESGLSFLGLGVQPPMTSLGNMVGYGRDYLTTAPWILIAPAVVISLTALSISLAGDWLRDRIDTSLR